MAYSGGIITAPVDVSDPYYVLGVGQYNGLWDVAYVISLAKSGGKVTTGLISSDGKDVNFMSAFSIKENGGASNDGFLIAGAVPYWNIYSNDSPGRWFHSLTPSGDLRFSLKPDEIINNGSYSFNLANWVGYNHNSITPSPGGHRLVFEEYTGAGGTIQHSVSIIATLGSYDWKKLNASKFKLIVEGIGESEAIPIDNSTTKITATLTINRQIISTTSYETYILIGNGSTSDFISVGRIPIKGEMVVEISPKPIFNASVKIGNRINVFAMSEGVDQGSNISFNGRYNVNSGVATSGLKLQSITYTSKTTGETKTITSFNSNESPTMLMRYDATENVESFKASKDRVSGYFTALFTYA